MRDSESLGVIDILLIIFIVLKLVNVVTWNWWLVLFPLWLKIAVTIAFLIYFEIDDRHYEKLSKSKYKVYNTPETKRTKEFKEWLGVKPEPQKPNFKDWINGGNNKNE